MAMPNTSDEGSVKNSHTEATNNFLNEQPPQSRQDALGSVIQNTITTDSNAFPSYIIRTLQE